MALLFAATCLAPLPMAAQQVASGNGASHEIEPLTAQRKHKRKLLMANVPDAKPYVASDNDYFVLQYAALPTDEVQQRIAKYATRIGYLQNNMYLYSAPNAEVAIGAIRLLAGVPTLTATGRLPLTYKLAPELYKAYSQTQSLPEEVEQGGVEVQVHSTADLDALQRTLDRWEATYNMLGGSVHVLKPTMALVEQLAAIPYVSMVEPYSEPMPLTGFDYSNISMTDLIAYVNYDRREGTPIGKGIYFSNWETFGAEGRHILNGYGRNFADGEDFARYNGHGTNCGLIAAGANNIDEVENVGMAPGMMIVQGNPGTYGGTLTSIPKLRAAINGAPIVSNHSIGWAYSTGYTYNSQAADVDRYTAESNNYVCCYPTGNASNNQYGLLSGAIKMNKNGMNVHSSAYMGLDVSWANFGPTYDGRMNPNICAEGTGGTSYASPGIAGGIGVLMEQFATTYPHLPMHANVCQAVLLNTAIDVRNVYATTVATPEQNMIGIDYRTGFGTMNLPAALKALTDQRVFFGNEVAVSNQEEKTHTIEVPAGQTELRVMLYWHDPAAVPNNSKALINDLDLEVITPDGQVILPWTLDPSNPSAKPTRKVNTRDNAEQVVLRAATKTAPLTPGTYTIRVKGTQVPQGPQKYVATWQVRERGILMTSIPEGQRFRPGQPLLLTWDMTLPDDEEVTALDGGQGTTTPDVYWRTSSSSAYIKAGPSGERDRGKNYFKLTIPSSLASTKELQFKVQLPNDPSVSAESNKAQVEQRMARPRVKRYDANTVRLEWDAVPSVTQGRYIIYALYDKYMTPIDSVAIGITTKDVAAPAGVAWGKKHYFAVAVRNTQTGTLGQRSLPVGVVENNEETTNNNERWAASYTLCGADLPVLNATSSFEGKVQWYVNDKPVPAPDGTARSFQLNDSRLGTIYYTMSDSVTGQIYHTSESTQLHPRATSISDTAKWGTRYWTGYVFHNPTRANSYPLLKDNLVLSGRFTLGKLGFDSHSDLFPWTKNPEAITGYVGCAPGDRMSRVIVMKRTGFAKGTYTFTVERASLNVEMIVRNGEGHEIKRFRSSYNSANEAPFTVELDPTSQVEFHWLGDHARLKVDFVPAAEPPTAFTPQPGRFYRIINAFSGFLTQQKAEKAVYMPYTQNNLRWKSVNNNEVAFLWQYNSTANQGRLTQANALKSNSTTTADVPWHMGTSGRNFVKVTMQPIVSLNTFADASDQMNVIIDGKTMHPEGHNNGGGVEGALVNWAGGAGTASSWYLEEAKTIDLKVGTTGWATVCYPFHVRLPKEANFKAYAITSISNNEVYLTQLSPEMVVAKGLPMVIEAPSATYTFSIDYDYTLPTNAQDPTLNANERAYHSQQAHATYAPHQIAQGSYVLANGRSGIGFYPVAEAGLLAENRTYIPKEVIEASGGGAPSLKIVITDLDGITSIRQTKRLADDQVEYFDLTGRRATKIQRGLYIGSDGSKRLLP